MPQIMMVWMGDMDNDDNGDITMMKIEYNAYK